MRIALDISSATPSRTGVGHTTYELAARLPFAAPHAEFFYLFHSLRQVPPRFPLVRRVRLIRRRIPGPLLLTAWERLRVPTADMLARRADIYHAPAMFLPPWHRVPVVVTIHDLFFLDRPDLAEHATWGDDYLSRALPKLLPGAATIICPSQLAAAQVERHFSHSIAELGSRLRVIPWGVSARWFLRPRPGDYRVLERLGIRPPYILSVAGASPRKNVAALLECHRMLIQDYRIDVPLVCLGLAGTLAAQPWKSTAQHIHCLPYLSRRELGVVMRNAVAYVCSSHMEGFGIPILEANAAGVPVVTTPQAGVLDFTQGAGTIVTADTSAPTLAEALARLLTDSTQRELLAKAGRTAAAGLTWRRTVEETLSAYEETLKSR